MYTQGLDQKGQDGQAAAEDAAKMLRFQERIDGEEKIEPALHATRWWAD